MIILSIDKIVDCFEKKKDFFNFNSAVLCNIRSGVRPIPKNYIKKFCNFYSTHNVYELSLFNDKDYPMFDTMSSFVFSFYVSCLHHNFGGYENFNNAW